jgi:peroxiredoxin
LFVNRNAVVLIVVVAVVLGMLVAARRSRQNRAAAGPGLSVGDVTGQSAPDFTLPTIDGKQVKLSELRGKAVLVNFWATWCGPCKLEIPWFLDLQKQYGSQGLVILGIAMDDNPDVVPKFAQEMKIDYPVLIGNEKVAEQYGGVEGLPQTFYVGRDGRIVKKVAGVISHSDVEDGIKQALGTSPSTSRHRVPDLKMLATHTGP